jgi:hypothetical protein
MSDVPAHTAADDYPGIGHARLREIIGEPMRFIAEKKEPVLGEFLVRFIAHSTFFCLATTDAESNLDISPKGDPPGSVKVLDPWTLALPERPGNRLADSFENILRNPSVALLFFVPGMRETLRVNGRATVSDDPALLRQLSAGGKPALLATVVRVEEAFTQCGKALIRAHLWEGDDRGLTEALTLGGGFYNLMIAQEAAKMADALGGSVGSIREIAEADYRTNLV